MPENRFRIRVRDINEKYIGQLVSYTEATFIPRWNGVGTWQISVPADSADIAKLQPGCGIDVLLPDGAEFTGHSTDFADDWDSQNSGGGNYTVGGVEDKAILGYRTVLPTPTANYTAQTAAANYVRSGVSETLIKNAVNDNLGPAALSSRILPSLVIVPTQGLGVSTSISARYDNLLDLVQRLASSSGLGFSLVSTPDRRWIFDVKPVIDAHNNVRFSRRQGNMSKYSFSRTAPTVTRAIVAGQGVGTARNITVYDAASGPVNATWGWLNENFIDQRQTNLASDFLQAANEAFANGGEQVALSFGALDSPSTRLGRDYGLGSQISVEIRGIVYTDTVTQITYTSKANELRIIPQIGDAEAVYGKALDIYRVVKSLTSRLALLERRY